MGREVQGAAQEDPGVASESGVAGKVPWQPSGYWATTSSSSSSWFDSWAAPGGGGGGGGGGGSPRTSKGVARSAERFGSASVGLSPRAARESGEPAADPSAGGAEQALGAVAPGHTGRDPVERCATHRFSGFSAPPVGPAAAADAAASALPERKEAPVPAPTVAPTTPRPADEQREGARAASATDGPEPDEPFAGIAGCDAQVRAARELVVLPIARPELFRAVGCDHPGGVLIVGPSGVGKTKLVHEVAAAAGANLVVLNGGDVVAEGSDSSKELKAKFSRAREKSPSLLFLDEVDALAPKTSTGATTSVQHSSGSGRMVSTLLTLLDESMRWRDVDRVIIVAASNRPHAIDPALRRAGRLDNEITIGLPDEAARIDILRLFTERLNTADDLDVPALARCTDGFSGADLEGLCDAAGMTALRECLADEEAEMDVDDGSEPTVVPCVCQQHFERAADELGPSGMRELRVERPNVRWEDLGGLGVTKQALKQAIAWPLLYPTRFRHFGAASSRGVIMHGPPGCGKTMLAKAVATECRANFISVALPDILTRWVGESEGNVREIFQQARSVRPCVLFVDEIDAVASSRTGGAELSDAGACNGVVSALLSELDANSSMDGVVVIGAYGAPPFSCPFRFLASDSLRAVACAGPIGLIRSTMHCSGRVDSVR